MTVSFSFIFCRLGRGQNSECKILIPDNALTTRSDNFIEQFIRMKQYCLALDLKDDEQLIAAYEQYHRTVWPEILKSIRDSGIEQMQIYRTGNRLFMIIHATDEFSFEAKAASDNSNERVKQWEELMWKFQQALPWGKPGEKWILMEEIFAA